MLSKKNDVLESNLEPTDNVDNQIGAHLKSESTSEMKVTESFASESMSPTSPQIHKKGLTSNIQDRFADDQQIEETKGELD